MSRATARLVLGGILGAVCGLVLSMGVRFSGELDGEAAVTRIKLFGATVYEHRGPGSGIGTDVGAWDWAVLLGLPIAGAVIGAGLGWAFSRSKSPSAQPN